jgi:hypothetical protein
MGSSEKTKKAQAARVKGRYKVVSLLQPLIRARSAPVERKLQRQLSLLPVNSNADDTPHVHLFSLNDKQRIQQFFSADRRNSLLLCGDSEKALGVVPDGLFQTCVTSPPYWSLRDYNIAGQIGLEQSISEYIGHLVRVFAEVRRTLRDDGTLWVNIGDAYTSGGRTWRATDKKNPIRAMQVRPPTPEGLKPKDLIGIPWQLAFALQKARLVSARRYHLE